MRSQKTETPPLNIPLKLAIFGTGRSQRAVAILARMSEHRLSRIVRGAEPPKAADRKALARVLGRSEAELFGEAVAS